MNSGKYVFSQIMDIVSSTSFQTIVSKYSGDYKVKNFSCWKQFLYMSFGQLTHRESLSDTLLCLKINANKLYHLGFGYVVALSTITRANEYRTYLIYHELAMLLIKEAKILYIENDCLEVLLKSNVFAIDATTIDISFSTFFWAKFRSAKSGLKLHTQLDIKTAIPEFILITNADIHDVNFLDYITYEAFSFYIMDKAYIDFKRLFRINCCNAFFISRAKTNMKYKRINSLKKDKTKGIIFDQTISLTLDKSKKDYPDKLRLIKFKDFEQNKVYIFITNNFELNANDIAQLYKHRWQIELFFKWIKQHLKIKSFWGQSENAVKTQIWIAISTYLIIAIAKKRFQIDNSLYEMLQVISISIFDKEPLGKLFVDKEKVKIKDQNCVQLNLFE